MIHILLLLILWLGYRMYRTWAFRRFMKKYDDNPLLFMEEVLGVDIPAHQRFLAEKLMKAPRPYKEIFCIHPKGRKI